MHLLYDRIVAKVVTKAVAPFRLSRGFHKRLRLFHGRSEWFLTEHVFSSLQRGFCYVEMQVVRRARKRDPRRDTINDTYFYVLPMVAGV
jgi:hypothetical protein